MGGFAERLRLLVPQGAIGEPSPDQRQIVIDLLDRRDVGQPLGHFGVYGHHVFPLLAAKKVRGAKAHFPVATVRGSS
jgi:hypothetical protein